MLHELYASQLSFKCKYLCNVLESDNAVNENNLKCIGIRKITYTFVANMYVTRLCQATVYYL